MFTDDFFRNYNPSSSMDNVDLFSKNNSQSFEPPEHANLGSIEMVDTSMPKNISDSLDQLVSNSQSKMKSLLGKYMIDEAIEYLKSTFPNVI